MLTCKQTYNHTNVQQRTTFRTAPGPKAKFVRPSPELSFCRLNQPQSKAQNPLSTPCRQPPVPRPPPPPTSHHSRFVFVSGSPEYDRRGHPQARSPFHGTAPAGTWSPSPVCCACAKRCARVCACITHTYVRNKKNVRWGGGWGLGREVGGVGGSCKTFFLSFHVPGTW